MNITVYVPVDKQDYVEKWKAIANKQEWFFNHLDSDVQREIVFANPNEVVQPNDIKPQANVPRPDFVSVYQWNQWLRDNGFDVGILPNENS
jgi:hypothetical protein